MQCAPFLLLALLLQQSDKITEIGPPPEPEAAEVFYALHNGKLLPLERQTPVFRSHAVGFIVMNTKSAREVPGAKSPVRFHSEERLELIVRSAIKLDAADPNTIYCVRRLDRKKATRELLLSTGRVSPAGGTSTMNPLEGVVPAEFSHYGDHSLKLATGPLPPGEYAVGRLYAQALFCFGVD
jgi:hypothetical protein